MKEESVNKNVKKYFNVRELLSTNFEKFTGHNAKCLSSFENFVELMHRPTDASSLGIGRIFFGILMLIDIPEERSGADLDFRWGNPNSCRFPLFDSLQPLSLSRMCITYLIMWLGALGIAVGYKFRVACLMFVVPYFYIFFLDKSVWNNHSYLYGLMGLLFLVTKANTFCSIDSWQTVASGKEQSSTIPFWNYFIIKYQFFILYFVAGLKKFSIEWLSGYAMENISYHWLFAPFRLIIGAQMTDLIIVHWFGCIFDLFVVFFLIYKKTRPYASLFAIAFHLMNSRLFSIGMFPWLCLAELPLFCSVDWPRTIGKSMRNFMFTTTDSESGKSKEIPSCNSANNDPPPVAKEKERVTPKQKLIVVLMITYCALQAFLPYSHFITQGYNNWTDGIYGYSWDMMIHSWDTIQISIKIENNNKQVSHYLDPFTYTETDRWTKHADMAYQYAHCINDRLITEYLSNDPDVKAPTNISIYYDIWSSLNGRFQQRIFDPKVDILQANWSPWQQTEWVMPLLEFAHMRPQMNEITEDVLSWSNYSDLLFIADFPGYTLNNYITRDLDNITLLVLRGSVRYEIDKSDYQISLTSGQSISLEPEVFHKVVTISDTPSCYVFTFVNKTMQNLYNSSVDEINDKKEPKKLPLWDEFQNRYKNYINFLENIGNSLLYEIYGVPMPRRSIDENKT